MRSHLPSTPAEVLDISTPELRAKINKAVRAAELFRTWKRPFKDAATSFEEMTLADIFYWVYKTTNPVTKVEKGERVEDLFMTDNSIVGLPAGFERSVSVTFGATGDILQAEGLENSKGVLYENVADLLFDQSISYANFESPVTTQPLKKEVIGDREAPTECCSREQFNVLKGHRGKNFTVMNTANNHMFDMGVEGIETTLKAFREEDIMDVGTNHAPEEFGRGKVLIRDGIKFGFATVTFGLNGHQPPTGEEYRVYVAKLLSKTSPPELAVLKQQIDHCKREGCDFIIASLHWGYEFEFFPRRKQVDISRELVEYGADAILSHHPHVVQPVEYYRTKRDPNRVAVISHSLGSMVWGFTAPHLALCAILNMTISKGHFKGRDVTYIEKAVVTPVFRSSVSDNGKTITRIEKLADHTDGKSKTHSAKYIAEIKKFADMVLANRKSAARNPEQAFDSPSSRAA